MTSISHALIGAAIAAKVADPTSAFVFGVVTHLACDMIPHWDLGTNWRLRPKIVTGVLALLETLVALIAVYFIFNTLVPNPLVLAVAIVASLIPDWLEAPYYILMPKSPKFFYYMYKWQSYFHTRLSAPWGIVTQVAVVAAFLVVGFVV